MDPIREIYVEHYAYAAKDDTAFTLSYIKCQANETRRVLVLVYCLRACGHVKVVFSIASALEFVRWLEEFVFPRESQLVIGNGSAEIRVRTAS